MSFKKILLGAALIGSFTLGSCYKSNQINNQPYLAFKEDSRWMIKTPSGVYQINGNDQLGCVQHRMNGLLYEKKDDLRLVLDEIKNRRGY
jgi:hypothetical protein